MRPRPPLRLGPHQLHREGGPPVAGHHDRGPVGDRDQAGAAAQGADAAGPLRRRERQGPADALRAEEQPRADVHAEEQGRLVQRPAGASESVGVYPLAFFFVGSA